MARFLILLTALMLMGVTDCDPEDVYQRCAELAWSIGELECRTDAALCPAPCDGWALSHCAGVWARTRVYEVCRP